MTVAINPTTGAVTQFCNLLPGTASWQCTSDRDAKENFIPADGKDVLRRLVAMPLFSWNFKGANPAVRLLGPTAQDFYAAFRLGNDDKTIASVNLEGGRARRDSGVASTGAAEGCQAAQAGREISTLKRELALIKAKLGLE